MFTFASFPSINVEHTSHKHDKWSRASCRALYVYKGNDIMRERKADYCRSVCKKAFNSEEWSVDIWCPEHRFFIISGSPNRWRLLTVSGMNFLSGGRKFMTSKWEFTTSTTSTVSKSGSPPFQLSKNWFHRIINRKKLNSRLSSLTLEKDSCCEDVVSAKSY